MKYQCLDCSFKGDKLSQGRCPACGSSMVKRLSKPVQVEEKEVKPLRLLMLTVLWGVLLYKAFEYFTGQ